MLQTVTASIMIADLDCEGKVGCHRRVVEKNLRLADG